MTDGEEKTLMARHGITAEHRAIYRYRTYVYGNLQDAVNYAELITERADEDAAQRTTKDQRARSR